MAQRAIPSSEPCSLLLTAQHLEIGSKEAALGDTFAGLAKLLEALKGYPPGQVMIVLGIVLLIIGGMLAGVSGLVS
jgi:hypothetical protein